MDNNILTTKWNKATIYANRHGNRYVISVESPYLMGAKKVWFVIWADGTKDQWYDEKSGVTEGNLSYCYNYLPNGPRDAWYNIHLYFKDSKEKQQFLDEAKFHVD